MKLNLIVVSFFCCLVAKAQISIDQHPVSNKNWATFLHFVKHDPAFSTKYAQSMLPDQWSRTQTSVKNQDEPVIGVSWQQALAYCEWRSVVATYLHTHATAATYQAMKLANTSAKTLITCRLPTEQEFNKLASRFTDKANSGIGFRCVYAVKKITPVGASLYKTNA